MKTINRNSEASSCKWFDTAIKEFNNSQNFTQGLDKLVELCGYRSLEHISRVMKQQTNKTPCEYMNQLRLDYAADKIIKTENKIIDIALEAGYNSLSYFNRIFKKQFGVSPTQYRKR